MNRRSRRKEGERKGAKSAEEGGRRKEGEQKGAKGAEKVGEQRVAEAERRGEG